MNLVAARNVEQPANNRTPAAVTAAAAVAINNAKCIQLRAPSVARKLRSPSAPAATGLFIAVTASETNEVS